MSKLSWALQKVKISDIKEFAKNPRWLTEKAKKNIKKSLDEFGLIEKLVLNKDMILIGGHQRLHILAEQGETHVDCWMPDRKLSEREHSKLCIMLNKAQAEFDFDMLANEWDVDLLTEAGFDLKDLGIDNEMSEGSDEENSILEPSSNPVTKLGDLYEFGQHRLLCGDCSKMQDIDTLINKNKSLILITDPPYGINMDKGFSGSGGFGTPIKRRKYKDEWDSVRPKKETFENLISKCELSIIWGGNFFADLLPQSTHWLVWDKQQTMPTFGDCELAWTSSERKSVKKYEIVYNGLIGKEEHRYHPTQKPVKLFLELINDYVKDENIVFDPFCGSGTTLIACEKLNRKCYAMELDPAYCDIILKRWVTETGQIPLRNGKEVKTISHA